MNIRKILTTVVVLATIGLSAMAQEVCVITIKADGTQTAYSIPLLQTITIDTDGTHSAFSVNLKNQTADKDGRVIVFDNVIPTEVDETSAGASNVSVYSSGKTIFVDAPERCDIRFYNLAGQQLGDCVMASHCECTISLAGTYIVVAGGERFKIQVQ